MKKIGTLCALLLTTGFVSHAHAQSAENLAMPYVATPKTQPASPNPLPSSVHGNVSQPLSTQKLTFSDQHLDSQLGEVQKQVNDRMAGFQIGNSADMKVPDIESDTSLKRAIEMENNIRYTKLRRAEVHEQMGLWGEAYDGPREAEMKNSSGSSPSSSGSQMNSGNSDPNAMENRILLDQKRQAMAQKLREDQAKFENGQRVLQSQQENEAERERIDNKLAQARSMMAQARPVVADISGVGDDLQATILVPYVGEVSAQKGGSFNLIDGSSMTITKLTSDGVTVRTSHGSLNLNFGSSVPSANSAQKIAMAIITGEQDKKKQEGPFPN